MLASALGGKRTLVLLACQGEAGRWNMHRLIFGVALVACSATAAGGVHPSEVEKRLSFIGKRLDDRGFGSDVPRELRVVRGAELRCLQHSRSGKWYGVTQREHPWLVRCEPELHLPSLWSERPQPVGDLLRKRSGRVHLPGPAPRWRQANRNPLLHLAGSGRRSVPKRTLREWWPVDGNGQS